MNKKKPPWKLVAQNLQNLSRNLLAKCSFCPDKQSKSEPVNFKSDDSQNLSNLKVQEIEQFNAWKQSRDEIVRVRIAFWILAASLLSNVLGFVVLFVILREPSLSNYIVISILEGVHSLVSNSLLVLALQKIINYYFSR